MRMTALLSVGVAGLVLLLSTSILLADPPAVSDPPSDEEITSLVSYWIEQIGAAKTPEAVTAAAQDMIDNFFFYDNPEKYADVKYEYAAEAGEQIVAFLADMPVDDLQRTREINAARALASLSEVSIQPALDVLVAHKNPAVRFQAWLGYIQVRDMRLAQGLSVAEGFFKVLQQRASAEDSPIVIGEICKVASLPMRLPANITNETYLGAADRLLAILHDNWQVWTKKAGGADVDWVCAATEAVNTLISLTTILKGADQRSVADKDMLQDLIDLAAVGGNLYARATKLQLQVEDLDKQSQQMDEAQKRDLALLRAKAVKTEAAAVGLLTACEKAINGLVGKNNEFVSLPLKGRYISIESGREIPKKFIDKLQQADAVQLGVIGWVRELKALNFDIQDPRIVLPEE